MFLRLVLVVVVCTAVFGGIYFWKLEAGRQAAAQGGAPPPAAIAATQVAAEQWQPTLAVVGSLAAVAGIEVTSEVNGKIDAIHFESGQAVEQGDLLVELDDSTDVAELAALQAERSLARLRYDRLEKLVREKSISRSDFDEARANLDAATARVTAQQALLDKKRIRAPFPGRLGIRGVDVGEFLSPGAAIVPLEQLDPIFVDFTLPERELARVGVGQRVSVRVQAYPDEHFDGAVEAIEPAVVVASRSFRLRARLDNPEQRLRPGMFAAVTVDLGAPRDVLTVPATAIDYAPYGDTVFVIGGEDDALTVARRQIEIGDTRDGRVEVVSGLEAGDRIVSAGANKLRNDQAVVVDDRPAPSERAALP
jgi:membrane fusion protein, multidrug efflux system